MSYLDPSKEPPAKRSSDTELVPLGGGSAAALSPEVLASLGHHLDRFAEQLSDTERKALQALLNATPRHPALAALGARPAEEILKADEASLFQALHEQPLPSGQGLRPSLVLVMKATRRCNLRCTYCHFWSNKPNQTMSFDVLARTTRGALLAPGVRKVNFVWHGGETTLLPLSFYRKALWLQQRFLRPGVEVTNAIQTNGTLLTDEWLEFLATYDFSVGVSLDGPPEIHDQRRLDAAGRPTAEKVRQSLHRLREAEIDHGVLMVVDQDVVALGAERLLSYFLEIGVDKVALLNVIPDNPDEGEAESGSYLSWFEFVEFLGAVFRLWWHRYRDRISFREISDLVDRIQGGRGGICIYNGNCMGGFLTIEPEGHISACDKYIGDPDYQFGNVRNLELADLPSTPSLLEAHRVTGEGVDGAAGCRWFEVCSGGCPHDRYLRTRHHADHDEACCGLASLLDEIAETVQRDP